MEQSKVYITPFPNGMKFSTSGQAIVSWVQQVPFISERCWFVSSNSLANTLFFLVILACWFMLHNVLWNDAWSRKGIIQRTLRSEIIFGQGAAFEGIVKKAYLGMYGMFLPFLHAHQFLLHHATTNWLDMCFCGAFNESRIVLLEAMSFNQIEQSHCRLLRFVCCSRVPRPAISISFYSI